MKTSLHWLLTGALLSEIRVPTEALAARSRQYGPYRLLLGQASRWLPGVYSRE